MNRTHSRIREVFSVWFMGVACALLLSDAAVAGQVPGTAYTTIFDGTQVNGNIYDFQGRGLSQRWAAKPKCRGFG